MTIQNGIDANVIKYILKPNAKEVKADIPRSDKSKETVLKGRKFIEDILTQHDSRLLILIGQCSTHDAEEDKEVSHYLSELSRIVSDKILIVKRSYFEKPRTGLGWEGLMIDPDLDGSNNVNKGLRLCRQVLLYTTELGLPCATEYVESQSPQYNGDFISWAAIGARTAASPTHRKLVSTLSMPVGIKNDYHGDISVAVQGILKAMERNVLPDGITEDGKPAIVISSGNKYAHLVLRGGKNGPNYDEEHVREAFSLLKRYEGKDLLQVVIIDCSHDNTLERDYSVNSPKWQKNYERQAIVFENGIRQRRDGNRGIVGLMMEANILGGNQHIPADLTGFDRTKLTYGLSVTDACSPLQTARKLIMDAYKIL